MIHTKKNVSEAYQNTNAIINILYLCQYGLLIPLLVTTNSKLPIVIFTIGLFAWFLIANRLRVNTKIFLILCFPLLLIIVKFFLTPSIQGIDNTDEILLNYLTIGLSGLIIGSAPYSTTKFLYYGTLIGRINFLFLFLIPLLKINEVNYMRFGYAMLPSFYFSLYALFTGKYFKIDYVIIIIAGFEILLFGARGSFISMGLITIISFILFYKKGTKKQLLCFMFILITIFISIYYETIMLLIDSSLKSFGYSSYALNKALRVVEGADIESTLSGRVELYTSTLNRIVQNPLIGAPLNSALIDTGLSYYHNIFLDVLVNFGVIIFLFFIYFVFRAIYKMLKSNNTNLQWVFCILFLLSFGRLMVSSIFWQRPEFWMFIGFFITRSKCFDIRKSNSECTIV